MTSAVLEFADSDRIGNVASVDTSKVWIDVKDPILMTHLTVGGLVAVQGSTNSEYLIGIIERATRSTHEQLMEAAEEADGLIPVGEVQQDVVRAVLVGTFRTVDGERKNVFKRGADTFPQVDKQCYQITSGNLQRFMNLLSADVKESERLVLGRYVSDSQAIAVANGDKFFQRHAAILGSTGSGKSWTVSLVLEKANLLAHPNIIVLDMHGEYAPLTKPKSGFAQHFKIAGPGDLAKTEASILFLPFWLLDREEMLDMILDRSDENAPNQATRFTEHVRALKGNTLRAAKNDEALKTFTVDSPVPYDIRELLGRLETDNRQRVPGARENTDKAGPWHEKLTRFIARLSAKIEDRRYGFMFQPASQSGEYNWLGNLAKALLGSSESARGIKIIDFSEVPSDVLPIVASVLARTLYDIQFWMEPSARTPICFVCDEAHLYLPVRGDADAAERRALATFERIAKEGRKYGVSLLVVSQRPSDVSRTILSQCNNFLALRLTNDQDQSVVGRLVPESMGGLTDVLPLLETGEGLLLGDAILLPTRVRLDPPKIKPDSATRDFWKEWASQVPQPDAIGAAVEYMRRQVRGK